MAGFTDRDQLATMVAIAGFAGSPVSAESGGDPTAINTAAADNEVEAAIGVWQSLCFRDQRGTGSPRDAAALTFDPNGRPLDLTPVFNQARSARSIFADQGFGAWSVFTSGRYRRNLPDAIEIVGQRQPPFGRPFPATEQDWIAEFGRGLISGDLIDAGGQAIDAAADATDSIAAALQALNAAAAKLLEAETWKRIGLVLGGVLLAVIGALLVLGESAPQALSTVLPTGKVGAAVKKVARVAG